MSPSKNRRRLILFRHAKSAWPENVVDHERPLTDRGHKAAPVMGAWLAKSRLVPDLVLVSTARRTRDSWALVKRPFKVEPQSQTLSAIYEASPGVLLEEIRKVDDAVLTLMLVGHNPGMEDLAKLLMADDGGEAGERLRTKFPTAAIAVLSFAISSWTDAGPAKASLDRFVTPKTMN